MNKELINGVIDATVDFIGACANDVCNNAESEYTVFEGSIKSDSEGNLKIYSESGDLVSQTPVRKILNGLKGLGHNLVDLFDSDSSERKAQAEAENAEIEDRITNLQSEISSLKFRKKHVKSF